jgi:hypothetical protein
MVILQKVSGFFFFFLDVVQRSAVLITAGGFETCIEKGGVQEIIGVEGYGRHRFR